MLRVYVGCMHETWRPHTAADSARNDAQLVGCSPEGTASLLLRLVRILARAAARGSAARSQAKEGARTATSKPTERDENA